MKIIIDAVAYLRWTYVLAIVLMVTDSNGFQMAFFKYADVHPPFFYLTESEIKRAWRKDERWRKEAQEMGLLEILKENGAKLPIQRVDGWDEAGLEMEVLFMILRHYSCK